MNIRYWLVRVALPLLACGLVHGGAFAQAWPSKPVKIVAGVGAGGPVDLVARILGQKLGAALGQPVVVENRAGAGGNLAAQAVAKAPADGHTLLVVTTSFATNVTLYPNLQYDPVRDFAPISQLSSTFVVLAVPAQSPVKNVGDLVSLAKSRQERINYASAGVGEANHLAMELLKTSGGFDAVHVPYKSMADAANALVGGQVDIAMLAMAVSLPQARAGKLRILATTAPRRSPLAPDVPTVAEAGVPGYELTTWWGLVAPAGTPRDIVERLQQETAKALAQPDVVGQLAAVGAEPVGSAPLEFARLLQSEIPRWGNLIRQSGAKAE